MEIINFVKSTVGNMSEACLEALKEKLTGEYVKFSIIEKDDVSTDVFMEKLCDNFEKIELNSSDKFDKLIKKYMADWDNLVGDMIPKEPSAGKDGTKPPTARSRKYYARAMGLKENRSISLKQLTDYSRIMMCLYMAVMDKNYKEIQDFDYSSKCLDIDKIVNSMRETRQNGFLFFGGGWQFDITKSYNLDTGVFILTFIMYYHIKNAEIEGEY